MTILFFIDTFGGSVVLKGTMVQRFQEVEESTITGRLLFISGGIESLKSQSRIAPGLGRYLIAIGRKRNHNIPILVNQKQCIYPPPDESGW